jgi:hypothetical protein
MTGEVTEITLRPTDSTLFALEFLSKCSQASSLKKLSLSRKRLDTIRKESSGIIVHLCFLVSSESLEVVSCLIEEDILKRFSHISSLVNLEYVALI